MNKQLSTWPLMSLFMVQKICRHDTYYSKKLQIVKSYFHICCLIFKWSTHTRYVREKSRNVATFPERRQSEETWAECCCSGIWQVIDEGTWSASIVSSLRSAALAKSLDWMITYQASSITHARKLRIAILTWTNTSWSLLTRPWPTAVYR